MPSLRCEDLLGSQLVIGGNADETYKDSKLIQLTFFFFLNDTATTDIYPLPQHDALPIWRAAKGREDQPAQPIQSRRDQARDLIRADEVMPAAKDLGPQEDAVPKRLGEPCRSLGEVELRDPAKRFVVDRLVLEIVRHVVDERRQAADRSRERGRDERPPLVLLADEAVDAIAERSDRLSRETVHPWIDG